MLRNYLKVAWRNLQKNTAYSFINIGGLAVGLAASFWASSLLGSLLYGVTSADYLSYAAAAGLVLGIAIFSSFLPARRASRVDPVVALRYE